MSDLLTAARTYMDYGLAVIALTGKQPNTHIHSHGVKDAFASYMGDNEAVRRAFEHPQTTGIGLATNYPYIVIDIDGEEGAVAWAKMSGDYMPDRWVARTRNGFHLWFADLQRHAGGPLAPKLDLKAVGGYVAAPPSLHPTGFIYKWLIEPDGDPPIELPPEAEAWLKERAEMRTVRIPSSVHFNRSEINFAGLVRRMESSTEGERNGILYWAAKAAHDEGAPEEVFSQLRAAANVLGLQTAEINQTMRSARR